MPYCIVELVKDTRQMLWRKKDRVSTVNDAEAPFQFYEGIKSILFCPDNAGLIDSDKNKRGLHIFFSGMLVSSAIQVGSYQLIKHTSLQCP